MATKKKAARKSRRAHAPEVGERLRSVDEALRAAFTAIAQHEGGAEAATLLSAAVLVTAANMVWHETQESADDFAEAARLAFQDVGASHPNCRGAHTESPPVAPSGSTLN